ncbi:MAG: 6,7-dimethyl-8-ribityllumazine synthase [Saprospiraceae bacterium]|nr:6,7-dimethyl-8-ribityllumazine synthase [Saprospiraceae bacterium]
MSSKDKNLSDYKQVTMKNSEKLKIGIVTSEWNNEITMSMKNACISTLEEHGIQSDNILQMEVPGAFELPIGARMMLASENPDAVICIGCVIKGETRHDEYISNAVAMGIMNLGLTSGKPVIFGVLTPNDMNQALDRAGGKYGNKGIEAAITALKMSGIAKQLKNDKKRIGFS